MLGFHTLDKNFAKSEKVAFDTISQTITRHYKNHPIVTSTDLIDLSNAAFARATETKYTES